MAVEGASGHFARRSRGDRSLNNGKSKDFSKKDDERSSVGSPESRNRVLELDGGQ
jgi:hypothetical protein